MKRISKQCKSLKQAEQYQNRLYNRFDSVHYAQIDFEKWAIMAIKNLSE